MVFLKLRYWCWLRPFGEKSIYVQNSLIPLKINQLVNECLIDFLEGWCCTGNSPWVSLAGRVDFGLGKWKPTVWGPCIVSFAVVMVIQFLKAMCHHWAGWLIDGLPDID